MIAKNDIKINTLKDLIKKADKFEKQLKCSAVISVCSGTGCKAYSTDVIYCGLQKEIEKYNNKSAKKIIIKRTACHGYCERGPIVVIYPQEICYLGVREKDIHAIIEKTIKGEIVEHLLFKDEEGNPVIKETNIPFYKFQKRIILSNNSKIDPESINDYIKIGGYQSLIKAI